MSYHKVNSKCKNKAALILTDSSDDSSCLRGVPQPPGSRVVGVGLRRRRRNAPRTSGRAVELGEEVLHGGRMKLSTGLAGDQLAGGFF